MSAIEVLKRLIEEYTYDKNKTEHIWDSPKVEEQYKIRKVALEKALLALEKQEKTNNIILDLLMQSCEVFDNSIIDNMCISAYEDACDYLERQGILERINDRSYKIKKEVLRVLK